MPSLKSEQSKSEQAKPFSLPLWIGGLVAGTALGMLARSRLPKEARAGTFDAEGRVESAERWQQDEARPFGESSPGDEPRTRRLARAGETGRGRRAASPAEVLLAGWRDIAWRVYTESQNDRLLAVAAGVVFYGMLALFPAITALVSSYALFADAATISGQLEFLSTLMPELAYGIVQEQVNRIVSRSGGQLSFAFLFGLALAIWSTNAGMKAMIDALNVIYDEDERRGLIRLNLVSLAFTAAAIVVMLMAFGAVIVLPVVLSYVGLGAWAQTLTNLVRWPALLVLLLLGLSLLYRFGPNRRAARWQWVSAGSVFATCAWLAGSAALSWYLGSFADYDATYGSLGAGIGLMMWLWMTSIVILVGAEINSEVEHRTARDTTVGRTKPLGTRGAAMADTVGAAKD